MERSSASNLTPQDSTLFYNSLNEHFDSWLVIFDNAENDNAIRTYLPKRTERLPEQKSDEQSARPARHILITSRAKKWGDDIGFVELNLFSPKEALRYLKSHLPASVCEGCESELKQIMTLQGSLPLGLAQASAYIVSQDISLATYLEDFKDAPEELLADEEITGKDTSLKTVYANLSLSLTKLSAVAQSLLFACSFLSPDEMPEALVEKLFYSISNEFSLPSPKKRDFRKIRRELCADYSLLNEHDKTETDETNFSMHRLTQQISHIYLHREPTASFLAVQNFIPSSLDRFANTT